MYKMSVVYIFYSNGQHVIVAKNVVIADFIHKLFSKLWYSHMFSKSIRSVHTQQLTRECEIQITLPGTGLCVCVCVISMSVPSVHVSVCSHSSERAGGLMAHPTGLNEWQKSAAVRWSAPPHTKELAMTDICPGIVTNCPTSLYIDR